MTSPDSSSTPDSAAEPQPSPSLPPHEPTPWTIKFALVGLATLIIGVSLYALVDKIMFQTHPAPAVVKNVPPFSFVDQTSSTVTQADLLGRPFVIGFVFTRCGGQCPMMTQRMREVQTWLEEEKLPDVGLVSVTVDPLYDTPDVLRVYANVFKADTKRWKFLTGDKATIYEWIQKGFLLGVDDNPPAGTASPAEPIIHSEKLVLVDAKMRIRDYYSIFEVEDMKRLRRHILAVNKIRE